MRAEDYIKGALFAGLLVMLGASACGQDVPSCATVCGLPGAPAGCGAACTSSESVCATSGCSGDFQAYLTCIGNAGTFAAVTAECATLAATVASETGNHTLPVDAGADADSSSCQNATCASVCMGVTRTPGCTPSCEASQAQCGAAGAAQFQALLRCVCANGGAGVSGPPNACAAEIVAIASSCGGGPQPGGIGGVPPR